MKTTGKMSRFIVEIFKLQPAINYNAASALHTHNGSEINESMMCLKCTLSALIQGFNKYIALTFQKLQLPITQCLRVYEHK